MFNISCNISSISYDNVILCHFTLCLQKIENFFQIFSEVKIDKNKQLVELNSFLGGISRQASSR